ncbi:MAG: leucine-rich repeat protein [Ruminococcus sp.]|nr:leucine-rich repeat protein [Ruminococcus sp.]
MKNKKKLYVAVLSFVFALNSVPSVVPYFSAEAVPTSETVTAEQLKAMQNFILNNTEEKIDLSYDLNGDNRIDSFDMCLLRKKYVEQEKSKNFYSLSSDLVHNTDAKYGMSVMSEDFYSKRIIVKAKKNYSFESYSPTNVISGPEYIYVVQFDTVEKAEICISALKKDNNIEYVELDEYMNCEEPTATSRMAEANSWGVEAIEADKYAEYLSDNSDSSVVVAVVDTGVASHSFIGDRLLNTGYDLVDNDPDPNDKHYHGTHVAGTVIDCTPKLNINIMPVRVLDENGSGSHLNVGNGIRYAAENGVDVINLSLGGRGCSEYIDDSIEYAVENGVTVVVAAGNNSNNTTYYCPAHLDNCIVVSACDSENIKANFSNYGNSIDVTAPGVDIRSCIPGGGFKSLNGTSMATPHISAAAAMIKYADENATPAEIEQTLKDISLDLGDPGKDVYYGYGLPKLSKLIEDDSLVASGKCGDDVNYTLDKDGLLTISGTGDMEDFIYPDHAPWYEYIENIKEVVVEDGVTSIGNHAFIDCAKLTSVTLPDSVTNIENGAFCQCYSLASVTIPDGVTNIGEFAFSMCHNLTSITIPESVISIGHRAFQSCNGLTSITIQNGVKNIEMCAFTSCNGLTSVTIPESVTYISSTAFSNCDNLTEINVSENNNNYVSVNGVLFNKNKTTLIEYPIGKKNTAYVIPNSVKSISSYAFSKCDYLTSVTIPNSVTSIGYRTFDNCHSLISITIPNSVTTISDMTFYNCKSLTSVTIPDSVTSIGEDAFRFCTELTSITIPDSVTSIGYETFDSCEKLETIEILNPDCKIYDDSSTINDTATIYGYANSTAQAYAQKYNRKFVSLNRVIY